RGRSAPPGPGATIGADGAVAGGWRGQPALPGPVWPGAGSGLVPRAGPLAADLHRRRLYAERGRARLAVEFAGLAADVGATEATDRDARRRGPAGPGGLPAG